MDKLVIVEVTAIHRSGRSRRVGPCRPASVAGGVVGHGRAPRVEHGGPAVRVDGDLVVLEVGAAARAEVLPLPVGPGDHARATRVAAVADLYARPPGDDVD